MAPGEGLREEGLTTGGVTCVDFSPFFHKYFLAGCGNGGVRLYKVNQSRSTLFFISG